MKKTIAILLILCLTLCGCAAVPTQAPQETTAPPTEPTLPPVTEPPQPDILSVHVLDVGQADCIFVECGGETLLIDSGKSGTAKKVVEYLREQGVEKLDYIVSTHGHYDHVGGFNAVLKAFSVDTVYAMTMSFPSDLYNTFLKRLKQQEVEISVPYLGQQFSLGDAVVTFLGPVAAYENVNDFSIVLRIQHGERSFLMAADMEVPGELDMLEYWGDQVNWHADVLKVGHHGLNTSTSMAFLRAVQPDHAVITCVKEPSAQVREHLTLCGTDWYRSDTLGNIVITTDGRSLDFSWEKASGQPENVQPKAVPLYIANTISGLYHLESCRRIPVASASVYYDRPEAAAKAGYTPCNLCMNGPVG